MAPIADEEWADLVAHELPKTSDPVIQKYLESRRALMTEEQKHRSDYSFRRAMSPIAKKACDIVSRICTDEKKTANAIAPKETTKSWQIIRRLPKGALLRGHCHTLIDIDHLLDAVLKTPGMCIASHDGHLASTESRREAGLCIRFKGEADSEDCSLWTDNYRPGAFIPLPNAADGYPEGGKHGLVEWLKERCGISTRDSDNREATRAAYSTSSEIISGMIYYEPIWRAILQRLMMNLVEDGIYWLELGLTFPLAFYREGSETPDEDYDHMLQAIEEEVAKFKATGLGSRFWGLRVIWSTMRSHGPRSIIEDADNCIAAKIIWPQLVAGYDLAGPESLGRPLADLLPELFWLRKQCALEDVQLPFFLRAGESLDGGGDATADGNLFDALLLGTRRIGNALSLYKHPRLVDAVRDKRVLVEICPTSNDAPGPQAGATMRDSLPALLAHGIPCALCDDSPGILSGQVQNVAARMTDSFWQALHAWNGTDLATLGSLAENSVRWAAFEDQDAETWTREIREASVGAGVKAARLLQWAVEWENFCLWIVTEYGDGGAGNTDAAE